MILKKACRAISCPLYLLRSFSLKEIFNPLLFSLSHLLSGQIHSVRLPVILLQVVLLHLANVLLIRSLPFGANLRLSRLKSRLLDFASNAKKTKSCQMQFIVVRHASYGRSTHSSAATVRHRIRYQMNRK